MNIAKEQYFVLKNQITQIKLTGKVMAIQLTFQDKAFTRFLFNCYLVGVEKNICQCNSCSLEKWLSVPVAGAKVILKASCNIDACEKQIMEWFMEWIGPEMNVVKQTDLLKEKTIEIVHWQDTTGKMYREYSAKCLDKTCNVDSIKCSSPSEALAIPTAGASFVARKLSDIRE